MKGFANHWTGIVLNLKMQPEDWGLNGVGCGFLEPKIYHILFVLFEREKWFWNNLKYINVFINTNTHWTFIDNTTIITSITIMAVYRSTIMVFQLFSERRHLTLGWRSHGTHVVHQLFILHEAPSTEMTGSGVSLKKNQWLLCNVRVKLELYNYFFLFGRRRWEDK